MTTDELAALIEGDQERWNRICKLVAWAVHKICLSIPRVSRGGDWRSQARSLDEMLRSFPPPGYIPTQKDPRVRRAKPEQLLGEVKNRGA